MVQNERFLLEDKTQSEDDTWFRDFLRDRFACGQGEIDYSEYPGIIASLLLTAESIAPRRELREKSSFNIYEGKSVKDGAGYELIWDEEYNHILRTPGGEKLSIEVFSWLGEA